MKIAKLIAFGVALPACFSFGYFWQDIKNGQFSIGQRDRLLGIKTNGTGLSDEEVFERNYARIYADYIKHLDKTELKYSAMTGLVSSLGDPHTNFFVPKVNSEFRDETQGKFYGIGARLLPDPLGVKVVSVFTDGPADKAGIKGGDVVIAVNGKDVGGMNSDDIVLLIKGEENTTVRLRVVRPNVKDPIDFSMKREKVVPPNVESKYIADQNIGYIKILNFALEVPEQFDRELKAVESHNIKGLIIDLRDNPGGALEAAVSVLSHWVDGDVIVKLRDRAGNEVPTNAETGELHEFKYPVVVLVNEDSASAAEIMAGVLKDYGKAKLVGTHTYGKFSVQTVYGQRDGAGIKLTIARYYLPKSGALTRKVDEEGAYISGGIQPDVQVDLNPDVEFDPTTMDKDAQFAKAVDVINGKPN
ncbi:MAG: PDZ domain-containing protein [Armatimonadetes bacterium]|nr:PDZ domain-containing protein [Armatimonadota bacterium]MBS1728989.1 S41 family peptidase [Armatimonadota bacterium]